MKTKLILCFIALCGIAKAQYSVLHNFNDTNGSTPMGSLNLSGGKLYGMTTSGGAYDSGCVFSLDTNGNSYRVLFNFTKTKGVFPQGSLTLSGNILYGMTQKGGANGDGCIFCIDTNGIGYKDLLDFNGTNGSEPSGSLILIGKLLYGMAVSGGLHGAGDIFSIDTNGNSYRDLFDFGLLTNGMTPIGSLTFSGKNLYGMTCYGGANRDGCIFSIDTNGNGYKDLFDFNGTNGANPVGDLTLSGGVLYGMTNDGGSSHYGNIFSLDTNGSNFKVLLTFNSTDGANPNGDLILSGGKLYGMTSGWIYNSGNIFSIDTNGNNFKVLFKFNGTNGANPYGNLTLSGSIFFGMAQAGGVDSYGVIFKIDTNAIAGINNLNANKGVLDVYPNPSTGQFTFEFNTPVTGTIEVYDITGRIVYQQTLQSEKIEINLGGQPAGMYFYRAIKYDGGFIGNGKILIEK